MDPVIVMNLVFDVVILLLAVYVYGKKHGVLLPWIAVAFGLFGVSYVLTILGVSSSLILIPLRALGYLCVIAGIALHGKR